MSAYVSDTFGGAASAVAPGAGAVVNTQNVADAGDYSAKITIEMSGTAETQLANLRLRVGGVNKITLPTTPGPAATTIEIDRISVPAAGTAVDVQAIAAATGGSIYTVTLLLTRES